MHKYKIILSLCMWSWLAGATYAQRSAIFTSPTATLSTLDELIAYKVMSSQSGSDALFAPLSFQHQSTYRAYYQALSALQNDEAQAANMIADFTQAHPTYYKTPQLWLQWGDYAWRHKNYKKALKIYQEVDTQILSPAQQDEFAFKQAYIYFQLHEYDKAKPLFARVSQGHSKQADYAAYYHAYLLFEAQDYSPALAAFRRCANSKQFKGIAPYYIAQIYTAQEQYAELIREGSSLERQANSKLRPSVASLVGNAYFEQGDYSRALPLLQKDKSLGLSPYGNYRMAYAAMQTQAYDKAIRYFEKVKPSASDIYQNALILLGNCYLQTNKKDFAAKAFYNAYQQNHSAKLKEDALFNFAKLSYELNNDPYQKAIHALSSYIQEQPNSPRLQEANTYLVNLFLSSHNHKEAYSLLKAMPQRSPRLNEAYQKIAFNRGVELFTAQDYTAAEAAFAQAAEQPFKPALHSKALYWQAASNYANKSYWPAVKQWQQALQDYRQAGLAPPNRIYYNIAFCYYQLKRYHKAISWFASSSKQPHISRALKADSYLRMADAYFVSKQFDKAIAAYQEAMFTDPQQSDYASYQIALAQGGKGDFAAKTRALAAFGQQHAQSPLADDALFELGTTHLILNHNKAAIDAFSKLCQQYARSPFKKQALLKTGLCYYNIDNNQRALEVLKQLVAEHQGSKEAKEALNSIQNIYVESDKAQDFIAYAGQLPNAHITSNKQDSITYMAAEHAYMNQGNSQKAITDFSHYINSYPQGHFQLYAHFYRGESYMRVHDYGAAKADYQYVLQHTHFDFVETSLSQLGKIAAHEQQWQQSLRYYQRLFNNTGAENFFVESLDGQIEAYKRLNMADSVLVIGQTILNRPQMPAKSTQKAHAYMAHAALQLNKLDLAEQEYSIVGKIAQGELAVEALYKQALIQYKMQAYKAAEDKLLDLIGRYASYDKWVTKSFILLADIYTAYGQLYQAKQTLQSVIEHQEDSSLVHLARQKKLEIERLEQQQTQDSLPHNDSIN